MFGRVLLAALLAGVAAGLLMGFIQHVRITPLILEAEKYENAGGHDHAAAAESTSQAATAEAPPPAAEVEAWAPEDGGERTFYTFLASLVTGAGLAAALAGVSLITGLRIDARNGLLWGLCAFLAFSLAPAAGLPPELPGMPAADLTIRQIWWVGTIVATAAGIYLIATRRETWAIVAAIVLIAIPHLIGAPQPASHESGVPAPLSAAFAANALASAAVFWCLIGVFLGLAMDRLANAVDPHAAA